MFKKIIQDKPTQLKNKTKSGPLVLLLKSLLREVYWSTNSEYIVKNDNSYLIEVKKDLSIIKVQI